MHVTMNTGKATCISFYTDTWGVKGALEIDSLINILYDALLTGYLTFEKNLSNISKNMKGDLVYLVLKTL